MTAACLPQHPRTWGKWTTTREIKVKRNTYVEDLYGITHLSVIKKKRYSRDHFEHGNRSILGLRRHGPPLTANWWAISSDMNLQKEKPRLPCSIDTHLAALWNDLSKQHTRPSAHASSPNPSFQPVPARQKRTGECDEVKSNRRRLLLF